MLENTLGERQPKYPDPEHFLQNNHADGAVSGKRRPVGILFCALGFLVCTLLSVTPLIHIPDPVLHLSIAPGSLLALVSSWLPTSSDSGAEAFLAYSEFFLLLVLAALCYGAAVWFIQRQRTPGSQRQERNAIWICALLAGAIYVLTPAMLSHDILVYASYSRVLATYHANPYFTPIQAFPHDPFTPINYWARSVSAYGPIWTFICGIWGWFLNPEPAAYVIAFRFFALAFHLLNIWLVGSILRTTGRPPRTVTLGMLLYAWNPLVLLESGLGGHNDVFMLTFVLLGILLAVRAEKREYFLRVPGYIPPVVALTLACLVKFTALPILIVYLLLLICRTLRPSPESSRAVKLALSNWRPALLTLLWSGLVGLGLTLLFYGPFWLGHSPQAILESFKNPPSANGAENSFMRSIIDWQHQHPELKRNPLMTLLRTRATWDDLSYVVIVLCLIYGVVKLWARPTVRTFVLVALATLCSVLLITPWFFSWYVTWILGLAVICLPTRRNRKATALLVLTLTFSFSALLIYFFNGGLLAPHSYLVSLFTTIPPVCAFLLVLVVWQPAKSQTTGDAKKCSDGGFL